MSTTKLKYQTHHKSTIKGEKYTKERSRMCKNRIRKQKKQIKLYNRTKSISENTGSPETHQKAQHLNMKEVTNKTQHERVCVF